MLELDRLTRRFGQVEALRDLSFTVMPGQMFGFVGSNGAGKTTAMRIVMGVDDPDDGHVRWRGSPIDRATRTRFGYMPEERGLYAKTPALRQLVYLGRLHGLDRETATTSARRWLERFGLTDRMNDPVEKLSLGNQQRVQLAAALIHEPELLVLDEPFSGLDPIGVDALSEVLLDQARSGTAVVFSSHQLELVERLCDSLAIIHGGRLLATGTVTDLRKQAGRPMLRIIVDTSDAHWTPGVPGVEVVSRDSEGGLLRLGKEVDDQHVLHAALSIGPVRQFAPVWPTLSDLYREVVPGGRRDASHDAELVA